MAALGGTGRRKGRGIGSCGCFGPVVVLDGIGLEPEELGIGQAPERAFALEREFVMAGAVAARRTHT